MTSLELSNKHERQVPKGIWRLFLVCPGIIHLELINNGFN